MVFAYVYVHKQTPNKSYQVIQTDWLQNFDLGTFICKDEQTRSSKPYLLRKPSEQNVHLTCQVITISETRSGIEKSIELKRWHIPKLSKSTIDDVCDESDDSNKSNGSEQEKQSRKIKKVQQTAAGYNAQQAITSKFKRINHRIYSSDEEDYENEFENPSETMQQRKKTKISPREVIDAHVKHAKKSQNTAEKSKFFSPLPTEQTNIFNPKITSSPKDKVGKGDMISPQEIFLNEDPLSLDYEECNENESKQSLEILNSSSTGNFLDAEKYAQYWKQKYDDLLKSKSFPITEKTGLKLIEILDRFDLQKPFNDLVQQSSQKSTVDEISVSDKTMLMTAPSKDGVKPKKNTVTDNLENKQPSNIPEINELCNKTFNSAADCAKSIVRSIWTQEELKDRVVRQTRGISKKVLTPEKVVKGKEMFASWLKKVGYMKDARNIELKQFNTHIGRVIDGAKKVDANKLKRKLEIDTNGTPPEKTPSKDLCEKSNNE